MQTAQAVIKQLLGDHLQVSKVASDMIELVMECTFAETNGLFADFISDVEQKVFNKHEDLPAYEWDLQAKVKILQKDPRFKSTLCSRGIELEILCGFLVKCDKFFWRIHRTIVTVAKERLVEKGEEVLNMHQVILKLRQMEVMQEHILDRQGDFNTSFDLHEKELVNIACNTLTQKQDESDKELILKNLHFVKNASLQQCRTLVNDLLYKNGINYHTGIYNVSVDRRTCRVTFNSDRDKRSAEATLANFRRNSKGKSKVTTARPDARTFAGDVRKDYGELKKTLFTYWQQYCNKSNREELIVSENVWSKNIFIMQRVTGRGADVKLFYEFTDPTNMESFLVLNSEQNPFEVLDLSKEVPNERYHSIAGSRAKTLNAAGIHTLKK